MKHFVLPVLVGLVVTPAVAQEAAPLAPGEVQEGFSLMEEGAKLLLKGLMSGMDPAMQDMGRALADVQPALRDLLAMMGDISQYHAPEMLDNGDIIIRRKPDAPDLQRGPEIEL